MRFGKAGEETQLHDLALPLIEFPQRCERIVEGKVKSYYEDHVLYDQKFARTESFDGTVEAMVGELAAKMGENISVRRMAMLRIGEDGGES